MIRRRRNLLALLSLQMCVAVCVLWVRSYFVRDRVGAIRAEPGRFVSRFVFSNFAVFGYGRSIELPQSTGWFYQMSGSNRGSHSKLVPEANAYVAVDSPPGSPPTSWSYTVPCWMPATAFAVAPAAALRRLRNTRRQRRRGLCRHCGYDLRASPDRCPECGTITVAEPVAMAAEDIYVPEEPAGCAAGFPRAG